MLVPVVVLIQVMVPLVVPVPMMVQGVLRFQTLAFRSLVRITFVGTW